MNSTAYQPKTGAACGCRPGQQRDNCPACEGTGQRIDFAKIRATSAQAIESRNRAHLKRCFVAGEYVTERATTFWSRHDVRDGTCTGEKMLVGSDLPCQTIRLTGSALLVCLTDTKGRDWFAWIHA